MSMCTHAKYIKIMSHDGIKTRFRQELAFLRSVIHGRDLGFIQPCLDAWLKKF